MNRVESLIEQYCPEGVEFKELREIAKISNGKDHKYLEVGNYPVYGSGGIMRYVNQFIYNVESVLIPRKGSIGNIFYVSEPFWTVDTIFYTKIDSGSIMPKFLYYYLKTLNLTELNFAGGVPSLTKTMLDKISIPIPPLPVQEEIVNILDKFTSLEAELEAELEARRKQYEYYRNRLLTFTPPHHVNSLFTAHYITIGECLIKSIGGGTPSKSRQEYWNGDIPWASVKDIVKSGSVIFETQEYITEEGLKNSPCNIIPKGNLIIITRINPGIAVVAGRDIAINQDLRGLFVKDFVNTMYFVYYLQTLKIEGKGTTVKGISIEELGRIKIPIPPLSEQERLVAILDKFDALVNDISEGLPAEIRARRKQYEYYRNKLLTFNPVVN